jgi:hypothetical protein
MFNTILDALESELRAALNTAVTGLVATARTRLEEAVAEIAKERAKGLAEVAQERADLHREIKAMQAHQAQQEGRVELNIGGYRFQTSVQTLRRVPHTFFDAYFSGRYAQDVCNDGSIFVDRDGEHFGHVLEYMRDGVVSVAEPGAHPPVSLLRALKREFGFYCIELCVQQPVVLDRKYEVAFVMGGDGHNGRALSSMERYDAASGQWSTAARMIDARSDFGVSVLDGEIYVIGGYDSNVGGYVDSVERYSPVSDSWTDVAPLPAGRIDHATVVVGSALYVLGGRIDNDITASVLKFDGPEGNWSEVAPMPAPRDSFASCTYMGDIYVFGGYDEDGEDHASVFKFDTEANEWSTQEPMPFVCTHHYATILNCQVYIVGAGDSGREVLRFNPMTNAWSTLARTMHRRDHGVSILLAEYLVAAGGGSNANASVERYDVATNTWTPVADMLEGRRDFGAVLICIESEGPAEEYDLFDSLIAKALTQRT